MILIPGDRQTGKTTRLVSWAREDPDRLILVNNWREAHRIVDEFEFDIDQVMPWAEIHRRGLWQKRGRPEMAIDNLDHLILERVPYVPPIATISWPIEVELLPTP